MDVVLAGLWLQVDHGPLTQAKVTLGSDLKILGSEPEFYQYDVFSLESFSLPQSAEEPLRSSDLNRLYAWPPVHSMRPLALEASLLWLFFPIFFFPTNVV